MEYMIAGLQVEMYQHHYPFQCASATHAEAAITSDRHPPCAGNEQLTLPDSPKLASHHNLREHVVMRMR